MKISSALVSFFFAASSLAQSQADSSLAGSIQLSAFLETYYTYDLSQPENHVRPGFFYSYNRHNEFTANLGFLRGAFNNGRQRASLVLAAGTYMNANYAGEQGVFKNIFEASAGFKISKNKNFWIDAGIFASHIGFESAIGSLNWSLTRGILADNSPYYESGVKATFVSHDNKWLISALVLNGWQRIHRVHGSQVPAFGHQLTYSPSNKMSFNSSSFVGSTFPDSLHRMRYFHNFYAILKPSDVFGIIFGFDIGAQDNTNDNGHDIWYTPNLMFRFKPSKSTAICLRGEYYADEKEVIITTGTPNGFRTMGYSVNFDYLFTEALLWRIEARMLQSEDDIFLLNGQPDNRNIFFTTSLAFSF